jgi:hypothetical protein
MVIIIGTLMVLVLLIIINVIMVGVVGVFMLFITIVILMGLFSVVVIGGGNPSRPHERQQRAVVPVAWTLRPRAVRLV